MTRLEKLKAANKEQIADMLCNMIDNISRDDEMNNCDICPAEAWCHKGHTGFINWLEQEAEE